VTATLLLPEITPVAVERHAHDDPPVGRRTLAGISAGLVLLCLVQVPGRIVADTKLDVAIAPLSFLHHALYLWYPQQQFGGVPFQAYGYLLPMGPFFAVGHLLGLPTWVIQRFWLATLLTAAFWGVVRLTEALEVGSPRLRVVAALAFVFAPPLTLLGATTDYLLPYALLPWAVVPLVRGARGGSTRLAACRSGVAILLMGGINAAATLAVLPLPFLYIVVRSPGSRRRQLLSWWVLAVFLACAWWAGSLVLEGRYGFNLLPFTESAATTTAPTSLFNVLRGMTYWVGYDQLGPTASQSGLTAATSPWMIVGGAALSALGLFGLAHRQMKERLWLVGTLAVGAVLLGAGYPGLFGSPVSGPVQSLLSGSLAAFRNVWKFQPMLNLVLALGLAHTLHLLSRSHTARVQARGRQARRVRIRMLVIPLAAAAVAATALPFLSGDFYSPGSFAATPSYWQATATWLGDHAGSTTSLVVPGTPEGLYTWGAPLDEPMQWLSSSDWAVRGLIPDGSVGSIETMDAVDQVLADEVPNPGLAAFLTQAGVSYLVVRNDLAPQAGAPTPLEVYQNLSATPGLARVARFGPQRAFGFASLHVRLAAVEVYEVRQPVETVTTVPVKNSVVVSGGAAGLLALDQLGLDPGNRAVFLAGDGGVPTQDQTRIVTDTAPRVGVTFGSIQDNDTYVLTPGQASPATGQAAVGWTIVPGAQDQTVARFLGVHDVTSSSFGSNNLIESPEDQPAAAFDGDPDTAWEASATDDSADQWIRVEFSRARDIGHITLALTASAQTPRVTEVRVSTARGSLLEHVLSSSARQTLRAPAGSSSWLKVTFEKVLPPLRTGLVPSGAGIRDLTVPGVTVEKAEAVPAGGEHAFDEQGARPPLYVFTSPEPGMPYGPTFAGDDPEPRMVRIFTTPQRETFDLRGTVTARPGASLVSLLKFIGLKALTGTTLHMSCGQGPVITIDGARVNTEVSGTFNHPGGYEQLQLTGCGPGSQVTLAAGTHVLRGNVGGFLKVIAVALTPASATPYAPAPAAASPGGQREVHVTNWGPEQRTLKVGSGAPSYLVVKENFNPGWQAQLNGRALTPVRIDGWQQAWVLPRGSGGTVTLTYGPDHLYQLVLVVGALLALLLCSLALWPSRRRREMAATGTRSVPRVIAFGAGLAALFLLVGVFALILPLLVLVAWFANGRRWLPWLAALTYAGAAIVVALDPGKFPSSGVGEFGGLAQIGALVALSAVFASVVLAQGGKRVDRDRVADGPGLQDDAEWSDAAGLI
jgi:arabinofuranan 3-O-arabinosyltransferase